MALELVACRQPRQVRAVAFQHSPIELDRALSRAAGQWAGWRKRLRAEPLSDESEEDVLGAFRGATGLSLFRELRELPESRFLSQMSLRIFRAGLRHELVDRKWPAFEEVFEGFDPERCARIPDERIEEMLADKRLIRNLPKLRAVRANAGAVLALRSDGGIGGCLRWVAGGHKVGRSLCKNDLHDGFAMPGA